MEAKCNFCAFFDEKQHCHNCKVFKKTRAYAPQKIDWSIKELVEYINKNDNIAEKLGVGDYKIIELITGEKVKMILLDTYKDKLAYGEGNAKATFGIFDFDGLYRMNTEGVNKGGWKECEMRNVRMKRFFRLLPSVIRNNIKPVIKHTCAEIGSQDITLTNDNCFLFSETETYGNEENSYPGEDEQYEYFMLAENKNFDNTIWLRSPHQNNSHSFCTIYRGSRLNWYPANRSLSVAFGFCI